MASKKTILIYLFLLFISNSLFAQSQLEMNEKARIEAEKADTELNKIYKQLMAVLDKEEKNMLIKTQKDWLKFRHSHCEFEAEEYDGGSMQPLIRATCFEERTRARIKDLKTSLSSRK